MRTVVRCAALAVTAAVVAYGTALAFPAPLFRHEVGVSGIRVFSRRALEPGLSSCFGAALARLRSSEVYDASLPMRFFEAGSAGWYRFFNGPYSGAMARHSEVGGNIFVPRFNVKDCTVEHFDRRSASIATIAAHEMVHRLVQHRIGLLRSWRLPWWKREGFAEFVARGDPVPIEQRIAQLDSGQAPAAIPRRYLEALIVTRYLFEVRHLAFDEFVAHRGDLDSLWAEIRRRR